MAINPEKTVRKVYSMPKELAARIDTYREAHKFGSEAEAVRKLIEDGLIYDETPEQLMQRCSDALDSGNSFGWIMANILDNHPKVSSAFLREDEFFVVLKDDFFITYRREEKIWSITGD